MIGTPTALVIATKANQPFGAHGWHLIEGFAVLATTLGAIAAAEFVQRRRGTPVVARPTGSTPVGVDGAAWRPRQTLLPLVALAGTAAAGVHYTVMPAHFNESALYGSFFLVAATAQLVYSVLLLCRPSRPLIAAGLAGNAAILLLWLLTRTIGIPLGPAAGETETFGGLDILAAAFEIVFVAGACGLLHKPRLLRRADWPPAWSPAIWIAAPIAVLAISVTAYAAPPS